VITARAYAFLLRLYPREYREHFGGEMLSAFKEAAADRQTRNRGAVVRFTIAELAGLCFGAALEWGARLSYSLYHSNGYIGSRCQLNPAMMLPAGITRKPGESGFVAGPDAKNTADLCPNAHQKYALASPLGRLAMSLCQWFFPIHRCR
jgi:hypothetical protein